MNKNRPIPPPPLISKQKNSMDLKLNFDDLEKNHSVNKSSTQNKITRDHDLILSDRNKIKYDETEFRSEMKRKRLRQKYTS